MRISGEWLFGDITNYLKYLDFEKNFKFGLSSMGKMYIVTVLLVYMATRLPSFLVVSPQDFLITLHKPKENNYTIYFLKTFNVITITLEYKVTKDL